MKSLDFSIGEYSVAGFIYANLWKNDEEQRLFMICNLYCNVRKVVRDERDLSLLPDSSRLFIPFWL